MKLKLVSLNIWKEGDLLDKAITFIHKENPDILCLQEVYNGDQSSLEKRFRSLNVLVSSLDLPYHVFAPAFKDITKKFNLEAEQGNLILSRYAINKTKTVFLLGKYGIYENYQEKGDYENLPRIMQYAKIKINSIAIELYNIHGIWGLDGWDNEKRLIMSQIITNEVKNKPYVILTGDFNTFPNTKTIANVEKYLRNVFKDELKTTFNLKRKQYPGNWSTSVVDMMFISKNINILEHYCPNVDVSDHLPLVCTIEIN